MSTPTADSDTLEFRDECPECGDHTGLGVSSDDPGLMGCLNCGWSGNAVIATGEAEETA